MAAKDDVPGHSALPWQVLVAVGALGGSAHRSSVAPVVGEQMELSDEVREVLANDGFTPLFEERVGWTLSCLKGMGLLDNSRRGVWSTTAEGRKAQESQVVELHLRYHKQVRSQSVASRSASASALVEPGDEAAPEPEWQDALLAALVSMPPDAFERLAQRLLLEAGFTNIEVTGRPGDGGVDGIGQYRLSLISFPLVFQCKRYRNPVGASDVRDFRGAMVGRAAHGIMITSSTFTAPARAEATRAGAAPIELIDGGQLCELLKQYQLGVTTTQRIVEDIAVDANFFAAQ